MQTIRHITPLVEVWNVFGRLDISENVASIRIQNSVDSSVGIMSLVLNPSATNSLPTSIIHNVLLNEAQKKLKINSIISAKIDRYSARHSFLGRIDNIYPRISADGNNTRRELVVNCSMLLPKILIRDEIVNFPLLQYAPGAKEKLGADRISYYNGMRGTDPNTGTNVFQGGSPEDAVRYIINNCMATNTDVLMGATTNGIIVKSFFNPEKADTLRFSFLKGEQLYNPTLSVFAGPLLEYIFSCIDRDFYEVFFDTETGGEDGLAYNVMTIRPKPFSFKEYRPQHTTSGNYNVVTGWVNFDDAAAVDVVYKTSEQRLMDATGISDYELKNSFSVNFHQSINAPANSLFGQQGPLFPLINFESVKKYGLRHLQLESTIANFDSSRNEYNNSIAGSSPQDLFKIASKPKGEFEYLFDKREKNFEWYSYPYFESGSIVWVGDEELRIGRRLIYEDKEYFDPEEGNIYRGVEYYINSVVHEFAYGKFFRTTTGVSRGAPKGLAAKWLNKNRSSFISPSIQEYNKYINPVVEAHSEKSQIENVRAQWREITEL